MMTILQVRAHAKISLVKALSFGQVWRLDRKRGIDPSSDLYPPCSHMDYERAH